MKYKYVVSNYDILTETAVPVAVFDTEEDANEYATLMFGDVIIDGWKVVDKVISFLKDSVMQ